jgi:hypothetical protein
MIEAAPIPQPDRPRLESGAPGVTLLPRLRFVKVSSGEQCFGLFQPPQGEIGEDARVHDVAVLSTQCLDAIGILQPVQGAANPHSG